MTDAPTLPRLTTKRLVLRAPRPTDLPAYAAFYAVTDLKVGGYRSGRSEAEVVAILERDIAHWQQMGFGMFLMRLKGSDRVMGGTGLNHPKGWPSHELTWWLMPRARGKGYASEASRAVISWAYESLGWDNVETHMRDENRAAHALAQRLGGTVTRRDTFPDGVTRDVYSLPQPAEVAT